MIALVCLTAPLIAAGSGAADGEIDRRLDEALEKLLVFSFGEALRLYDDAARRAPRGSEPWQKAVFGAGLCAHHRSPATRRLNDRAAQRYRELIDVAPSSAYAPRTMMNLGRIAELQDFYEDKVDLAEARRWYSRVKEQYAELPIAGEAALRIAATHIQTCRADEVRTGVDGLQAWLATHPDDPKAAMMWRYMGDACFLFLRQYARAVDCYVRADEIGLVDPGRKGILYWRIAAIAEQHLDDRTRAITYYRKIVTDAPTSGKAYEAQLALRRLGETPPPIEILGAMKRTLESGEGAGDE